MHCFTQSFNGAHFIFSNLLAPIWCFKDIIKPLLLFVETCWFLNQKKQWLVINHALTHPYSATLTHTLPKKGHIHLHPPTPSQKKIIQTHTDPHPAKKRSNQPIPSQKKGHKHPYLTHTQPGNGHIHPTKRKNVMCMIYKWKVFPFHNINRFFHFWKRLTCYYFSIEYFWNSIWIYC